MSSGWPFEIIFEDQHLIVLSKSAGLLSQSDDSGEASLVDHLRSYFGRNYVGIVHRLDRNTSGLMVVAKRSKAATRLSDALKAGDLIRRYQALVYGELPGEFRWKHYLLKDESNNKVRAVPANRAGAKEALLSGKRLKTFSKAGQILSLGEFILETGRSHQIRVQATSEGFPLVGDTKYLPKQMEPKSPLLPRPALHSCYLKFSHPMSQENMEFQSPLPQDIVEVLSSAKSL